MTQTGIRVTVLLLLVALLQVLAAGPIAAATDEDAESAAKAAATAAAESWLGLVDRGEYAASWSEAAAYFRSAVPSERWEQMAAAVRNPLGKIVSRRLQSAELATSLPGAPDGEYVVLRFDAAFENKASAVETVTPMKDPDGTWRVSGYFIK